MSQRRGLVAITGANGFVGYHCVLYAIQAGYGVRCIVRSAAAVETIRRGPSIIKVPHLIEYRIVPDMTVAGAFDEALYGVDYVMHVAGPSPKPHLHPDQEVYTPYIELTRNILSAAERTATIRRIVFTHSTAGFINPYDQDLLGLGIGLEMNEYTPANLSSAARRPPLRSPIEAYCAAQAYSMASLKALNATGNLPFSIVQVTSGRVLGTFELKTTVESAKIQIDRISKAFLFDGPRVAYAHAFVHVWDCARIHVEALDEVRSPADQIPDWFLASASTPLGMTVPQIWTDVADMLEREFSEDIARGTFTIGRHNWPLNSPFQVNSRLTASMLMNGDEFRPLADCVREVAAWYRDLVLSDPGGQIQWSFH